MKVHAIILTTISANSMQKSFKNILHHDRAWYSPPNARLFQHGKISQCAHNMNNLNKEKSKKQKKSQKKSISQIAKIICDQKQTVLNKRVHIYKISTANVMLNGGMFIPVRKSFRNSMLWITSPMLISVWIVSFPIFKSLLNLY